MGRQTLANLIPLAAIVVALAEYLFDRTAPRYAGPWFWLALGTTIALLVAVQVLRFTGACAAKPAKPDYSATTLVRGRRDPQDKG